MATSAEIAEALERVVHDAKHAPTAIPFNKDARNPETKREFFATIMADKNNLYHLIKRQYEVETGNPLSDETVLSEFIDQTPESFYDTDPPTVRIAGWGPGDMLENTPAGFRSMLLCYIALHYYEDSEMSILYRHFYTQQYFDDDHLTANTFENELHVDAQRRRSHLDRWRQFFDEYYHEKYTRLLGNAYSQTPPMTLKQWLDYRPDRLNKRQVRDDENTEDQQVKRAMGTAPTEECAVCHKEYAAQPNKPKEKTGTHCGECGDTWADCLCDME